MMHDQKTTPPDIAHTVVDGRRVRYRIGGGRPASTDLPLLCLHGLGCSSDVWRPLLRCDSSPALIAPDMPGYGKSPGPPRALDIPGLADWLARFLDAVGVERVHAAGHSMGCQVALAFAKRHPDRAGRLILAAPTLGCRHCSVARYAAGLLTDAFHETALYTGVLLRMCGEMGPRRYLATVAEMMRDDAFEGIERITEPVLVVRGRHDPIVSRRLVQRLVGVLPRGEAIEARGVAHAIPFTKPAQFLCIARDFLAR